MGHKILIVDDEADMLSVLEERLTSSGYKVAKASSGVEAVEQAEASDPDLIVMDIKMPDLDGIASILKIKSVSKMRDVPVIVFTSVNEDEDRELARNLGAAAYVHKNKMDDLLKEIERILK